MLLKSPQVNPTSSDQKRILNGIDHLILQQSHVNTLLQQKLQALESRIEIPQ